MLKQVLIRGTILFIVVGISSIVFAEGKEPLTVTVRPDKDIYLFGEPITINTTVVNTSDKAIAINKKDFSASGLDVKDEGGNAIFVSKEYSSDSKKKVNLDDYVLLEPNEIYVSEGNMDQISAPGEYSIGVPSQQAKMSTGASQVAEIIVRSLDGVIRPLVSD